MENSTETQQSGSPQVLDQRSKAEEAEALRTPRRRNSRARPKFWTRDQKRKNWRHGELHGDATVGLAPSSGPEIKSGRSGGIKNSTETQ